MTPEMLQSLTAAKGLPMPIEEGVSVDQLARLFAREKRLIGIASRLHARGEIRDATIEAMAAYFGVTVAATSASGAGNPAHGKNSHSVRAREWTHAECAQACQGIDECHYHAHRYTYALDDSVFHSLGRALWEWALAERERRKWPARIVTLAGVEARYMRELVDMWLIEVRAPWRFKRELHDPRPNIRRVVMNVSEEVWSRRLSRIYRAIGHEFETWLAIAHSQMAPRLSDVEE